MSPNFIRQLIIQTICNVTGGDAEDVRALPQIAVSPRDWEQIFSRLEAHFDLSIPLRTAAIRTIDIDALTEGNSRQYG